MYKEVLKLWEKTDKEVRKAEKEGKWGKDIDFKKLPQEYYDFISDLRL